MTSEDSYSLNMKQFQGRVAVVTGAASGIGRALAVRFAQEGMRVMLADLDEEALRTLESALGPTAITHITDVSDEESVRALAERAYEAFGAVHILCNNAGVAMMSPGPVWESTAADWEWVLGVTSSAWFTASACSSHACSRNTATPTS